MNIAILASAERELDEAVEYYESQQFGLGTRFRNEVILALHRIQLHPQAYPLLSARARRCLVSRFPYGIIYQHKPESHLVLVVAIAHLHRKPDYWQSRT